MSIETIKEDFKLLAELLRTDFKDFHPDVQAQICRSYVDAVATDRRRPVQQSQAPETNSKIRGWCLSPDFANEFISRNKNRLVDALFEESHD